MLQMRPVNVSAIQGPRDNKRRERDLRVHGLQLGRSLATLSSWHSPRKTTRRALGDEARDVTDVPDVPGAVAWSEIVAARRAPCPVLLPRLWPPAAPRMAASPHSCAFQRPLASNTVAKLERYERYEPPGIARAM